MARGATTFVFRVAVGRRLGRRAGRRVGAREATRLMVAGIARAVIRRAKPGILIAFPTYFVAVV